MDNVVLMYLSQTINHMTDNFVVVLPVNYPDLRHLLVLSLRASDKAEAQLHISFIEVILQSLRRAVLHLYHHID